MGSERPRATRPLPLPLAETPADFLDALPGLSRRLGPRLRAELFDAPPRWKGDPRFPLARLSTPEGSPRLLLHPAWEDAQRHRPINARRLAELVAALDRGELEPVPPSRAQGATSDAGRGVWVVRLWVTAAQMMDRVAELHQAIGDLFRLTVQTMEVGGPVPFAVLRIHPLQPATAPLVLACPSYRGRRVHRTERLTDTDLVPLLERLHAEGLPEIPAALLDRPR